MKMIKTDKLVFEYAKRDGTTGISYNVKKVFDVSQTNGKRPPAPTVNRDPKALITTMLDSSPVNVEAADDLPYPNMAAFYNNEEQTLYVKRSTGTWPRTAFYQQRQLQPFRYGLSGGMYRIYALQKVRY